MQRTALICLLSVSLQICSCESTKTSATSGPEITKVAHRYSNLRSITKEPVYVNPQLAMLCRGATRAEVEAAAKRDGPHAHTRIQIYMNDLAADAFAKSAATFPVGSIIVKEKHALRYWRAGYGGEEVEPLDGVGGMIKRPVGFDSQHGDWEYFYFNTPEKIERGKIASCVQCHAGATEDHVFGNWRTRD